MKKLLTEKTKLSAIFITSWNILYCFFNLVLMRIMTLLAERKQFSKISKYVGAVMLLLAITLAGINVSTIRESVNPNKNMIIVIAQAAFTFTVFILAIINMIHAAKQNNIYMTVSRNIAFASAIGSMLSLERSMLGTFDDPAGSFAVLMEAYSGGGAFILLILLAIGLITAEKRKAKHN